MVTVVMFEGNNNGYVYIFVSVHNAKWSNFLALYLLYNPPTCTHLMK